ncbi:hypothetical protein O7983_000612 [Mycoplasmopsis felis]|uniref:FAD synthase n=1 Tax=Mycoplasmopsis felis TaxID=33923 RepID=UPI003A4D3AB3
MNDLIIYDFDEFITQENDSFIIGSFESFHLGHYQLYKQIKDKVGRKFIVTFTMNDYPIKYDNNIYMNDIDRYHTFGELNIHGIVELNFSRIKNLTGNEFLAKLSQNKSINISVGKDFKFGYQGKWTSDDIKNILKNSNVYISDIYKINDVKISTKLAREALYNGHFNFINSICPFNYYLTCELNKNQIIYPSNLINIPSGIYFCNLYYKDLGFNILMHKNKNDRFSISLIDDASIYTFENIFSEVILEIVKEIRFIYTNDDDSINKEDILEIKKELCK